MDFYVLSVEEYCKNGPNAHNLVKPILNESVNPLRKSYKKMLDIGCGPGDVTRILSEKFCVEQIIAIDKCDHFLEFARNNHTINKHTIYEKCDLNNEKEIRAIMEKHPDIDLVVSCYCLFYLENPIETLKIIKSCLKGTVEHMYITSLDFFSSFKIVIKNIPQHPKWSVYLQNVEIPSHLCTQESSNHGDFESQVSSLYHKEIIKKAIFTELPPIKEAEITRLKVSLPFIKRIPSNLLEEFLEDCHHEWFKQFEGNEIKPNGITWLLSHGLTM